MNDRPRALLFDLGRVLVGYDWTASLARLADRLAGVSAFDLADWMLSSDGPHDPYCTGHIDERAVWASLRARFPDASSIDDAWLAHVWNDMFEPWPDALALVDRLRGQARLGLVSNTNHLHFEHLDRELDLRGRFDHVAVSHEVGALKPALAIFEHALKGLDVEAAQAWFTDDLPANLDGAAALGIRTHAFASVESCRRHLGSLGFDA